MAAVLHSDNNIHVWHMPSPQTGKFKIHRTVNWFTYSLYVCLLQETQGSLSTYGAQSQTWKFCNLNKHVHLNIYIPGESEEKSDNNSVTHC